MSLYITNPEADRLARDVAARTGETLTDAVVVALRERLERLRDPTLEERLERATTIARQIGNLVRTTNVTADELYDEHGLPA